MAFRKKVVPDKDNHSIEIPEEFYGKTVEVIVTEVESGEKRKTAPPPPGKKVSAKDLLEHFGERPDFPTIDEIRKKAWPSKW